MTHTKLSIAALCCLFSSVSVAQVATYQDWRIDHNANIGLIVAETVNDNGSSFGQMCDIGSGTCAYVLKGDTPCKDGDSYVSLINSPRSAFHTFIKCIASKSSYYYEFQNFDDINITVLREGKIGIVYPLEGGNFKVYRFSLMGSKQANEAMRDAAEKALKTKSNNGAVSNSIL